MNRLWILLLAPVLALLPAGLSRAQDSAPAGGLGFPLLEGPKSVTAALVPSHTQVKPGQTFHVAVDIRTTKDWVYYSPDPGTSGDFTPLAGGLKVQAGRLRAGEPLWPADAPHTYAILDKKYVNNAYEGRAIVYIAVTVPSDLPAGSYPVSVQLLGQTCGQEECLSLEGPNAVEASATVTVGDGSRENPAWGGDPAIASGLALARTAGQLKADHAARAPAAAGGPGAGGGPAAPAGLASAQGLTVWAGLGLALLAGLILNIMPCVLPVVPLKILNLVQHARESRRRFVTLGLSFVAGVMLFFAVIAAANVTVHLATAQALSWGEHFQSSGLRIGVTLVVVMVACNLLGAFTVVVPALGGGEVRPPGSSRAHASALGNGVLTAFLSTPCSFGILTLAFAWAQLQPLWLGTVAILAIGVGMAAPYAVLTAFPGLLSRLPRPGRWMELFKQSMGFVMLVVAVWLVSTLTWQTYPLWVAAYCVVFAFCLWMWGTWVRYGDSRRRKAVIRGLAVAIAVASGLWMLRPEQPLAVKFEPFDAARIAAARRGGRIVLVDFTAQWCLTCKTVEALVYDSPEVARELGKLDVLPVKGDVTTADMPANAMLKDELREPGVPVSVIFPPGDARPIRLHGVFSKADLLQALRQAERRD